VAGNMRLVLCWMMTVAVALAAVGGVMSSSPTPNHRLVLAVSLAFMVLFNGSIWCMLSKSSTERRRSESSRSRNAVTDVAS
jgi:hypothetical protein